MAESTSQPLSPSVPELEHPKTPPKSPQHHSTSSSPPFNATPPSRSPTSRQSRSPLSLDLSSVPPLSQPSPPSNTLLITNLESLSLFHPASLATIRQHIQNIAPIYTFSPLKSLRRIIVTFYNTEAAILVRQEYDGANFMGDRTRVYFGEPIPIDQEPKYLDKPDAGKLFFISPPPSPPMGWEMKNEDPPNKQVHAVDLADALSKLDGKMTTVANETGELATGPVAGEPPTVPSPTEIRANNAAAPRSGRTSGGRTRSGSTVIYDPEAHGDSPALPAVILEDMSLEENTSEQKDIRSEGGGRIMKHTSRPPLELIEG